MSIHITNKDTLLALTQYVQDALNSGKTKIYFNFSIMPIFTAHGKCSNKTAREMFCTKQEDNKEYNRENVFSSF